MLQWYIDYLKEKPATSRWKQQHPSTLALSLGTTHFFSTTGLKQCGAMLNGWARPINRLHKLIYTGRSVNKLTIVNARFTQMVGIRHCQCKLDLHRWLT